MPRLPANPEAVALIARAVTQLARRLRAARPEGSVSLSALSILATLHRLGPMPAVKLAQAERLKPQSLTRLLADLDADGLIRRTRDTEDKRMLIIEITSAGRATLAHDMAARRAWLAEAMGRSLDSAEQGLLARAAELMQRLALESPPPDPEDP